MKLSDLIRTLQDKQKEIGDVDLHIEENDGRSTYPVPFVPKVEFRRIWKGNPPRPLWFIK